MVDYSQFYYQEWPILRWEKALIAVLNFSRLPQEPPDDILRLAGAFGHFRAQIRKAEFEIQTDVPHVLAAYCWWPFKPPLSADRQQQIFETRLHLLEEMPTVEYYSETVPLTQVSEITMKWASDTAPQHLLSMSTWEMLTAISKGEVP